MSGLGFGTFLFIVFLIIVFYAVKRGREGAAFRNAERLAAAGQPGQAIRAVLSAEERWGFNTAHDVRSTRIAALDRLEKMVSLAAAQAQAMGRPIDPTEVLTFINHLRHLLGTKEHYSWGSNAALKSEFKQHIEPLIGQLTMARGRFRAACSQLAA